MMYIPGYVHILIGIVVSLVSYFSKLYAFIIVGVGFILWGLFKIIIFKMTGMTGKVEKKPEKIEPHKIKKEENPVHQHPTVIACPSCGLKHYGHANYCQHCGTRIKK